MKDTCAFCQPEDTRKMIKALNEHGQAVMVHADEHDAYSKRVAYLQLEQSEKAIAEMVAKVDTLKALLAESEEPALPEGYEVAEVSGEGDHQEQYRKYLEALRVTNENPIPVSAVKGTGAGGSIRIGDFWQAD